MLSPYYSENSHSVICSYCLLTSAAHHQSPDTKAASAEVFVLWIYVHRTLKDMKASYLWRQVLFIWQMEEKKKKLF